MLTSIKQLANDPCSGLARTVESFRRQSQPVEAGLPSLEVVDGA